MGARSSTIAPDPEDSQVLKRSSVSALQQESPPVIESRSPSLASIFSGRALNTNHLRESFMKVTSRVRISVINDNILGEHHEDTIGQGSLVEIHNESKDLRGASTTTTSEADRREDSEAVSHARVSVIADMPAPSKRDTLIKRKSVKRTNVSDLDEDEDGVVSKVNQYTTDVFLGKGAFGNVYKVINTESGEVFAMKVLDKKRLLRKRIGKDSNALQKVKMEIAVWKRLIHPNCLTLLEVIEDDNYFFMISEFMDCGAAMLDESEGEPLPKEKARYVFYQVMEGLEYLHFHNIMHRDIKPGNILLDVMNTAKICDFGLSSFHTEGERTTVTQGTAFFMPPEMTNESSFDPKDHDLWACGVTLFMFVFGYLPFQASNLPDLYSQIQTAPLTFPSHCKDNDLEDLLCRMLEKDQKKRLTLIEIQRHPWLKVYYEKDIQIKRERKRSQLLVPIVLTEEEVQQSFTPLSKMNNLVSTKGIASFMKKATQAKMELARSTST